MVAELNYGVWLSLSVSAAAYKVVLYQQVSIETAGVEPKVHTLLPIIFYFTISCVYLLRAWIKSVDKTYCIYHLPAPCIVSIHRKRTRCSVLHFLTDECNDMDWQSCVACRASACVCTD